VWRPSKIPALWGWGITVWGPLGYTVKPCLKINMNYSNKGQTYPTYHTNTHGNRFRSNLLNPTPLWKWCKHKLIFQMLKEVQRMSHRKQHLNPDPQMLPLVSHCLTSLTIPSWQYFENHLSLQPNTETRAASNGPNKTALPCFACTWSQMFSSSCSDWGSKHILQLGDTKKLPVIFVRPWSACPLQILSFIGF
jgi:hypothetical protein